jgi:hypothetical protein
MALPWLLLIFSTSLKSAERVVADFLQKMLKGRPANKRPERQASDLWVALQGGAGLGRLVNPKNSSL